MHRLTYKAAGVDIHAGEDFVRMILPMVRSTFRPEVMGDIGGFGGLFALDIKKYRDPVLVSGTDGVGTKLRIAQLTGQHDTVGIDLVAMCVNDVAVSGAEPLFFLDYMATGHLKPEVSVAIIRGIVKGCKMAGCALIGGETAEMPSFYPEGEYDLAGFAVGIVERARLIDGSRIKPGDVLVGLSSAGLHSNGYSLARKVIFEIAGLKVTDRVEEWGKTVGDELLTPTRIYVKTILRTAKEVEIKGLAHITGGGITGNLPRIFPNGCSARIRRKSWPVPPVFTFIEKKGAIDPAEMYRVFNMGIGLIMVVAKADADKVMERLSRLREQAHIIGEIVKAKGAKEVIYV
jgi:phosphoribosylformylglycinamidine cyclo-ligase